MSLIAGFTRMRCPRGHRTGEPRRSHEHAGGDGGF